MQKLIPVRPSEAIRKYCAAFPALRKDAESPLAYLLPPPEWCRKDQHANRLDMNHIDIAFTKEKPGRERRYSHRSPKKRKMKKRCLSFSNDSKENLPEWVTDESAWDSESQDPVRAFIRALACDERFGKCNIRSDYHDYRGDENTVPDWSHVDLEDWDTVDSGGNQLALEESYAELEAKFDSSIEALWCNETGDSTPTCPSSPLDTVWTELPADSLHDRLRPLRLADEPVSQYCYNDVYESVPSDASTVRSLTALNHCKSRSSFAEVPPRRSSYVPRLLKPVYTNVPPWSLTPKTVPAPSEPPTEWSTEQEEDLLTSARTHFCPIVEVKMDSNAVEAATVQYADGAQFEVDGEWEHVTYTRSDSGSIYLETDKGVVHRYLEYLGEDHKPIDDGLPFSLKFRMEQVSKATQTEEGVESEGPEGAEEFVSWEACDECCRLAGAKKMRAVATQLDSIWSEEGAGDGWCGACAARGGAATVGGGAAEGGGAADESSRDWEELLADISHAHARYAAEAEGAAGGGGDRKRRHSARVWCARGGRCPLPHDAPFLHCCAAERPLTR